MLFFKDLLEHIVVIICLDGWIIKWAIIFCVFVTKERLSMNYLNFHD